jgi:hypothetical protein
MVDGRWFLFDRALFLADTSPMKFARISFASRDTAIKAYAGLARRGRVVSLPEGQFIVPEPALEWLKSENLPYELLQWLNQDDVTQTLRDPAAHTV